MCATKKDIQTQCKNYNVVLIFNGFLLTEIIRTGHVCIVSRSHLKACKWF